MAALAELKQTHPNTKPAQSHTWDGEAKHRMLEMDAAARKAAVLAEAKAEENLSALFAKANQYTAQATAAASEARMVVLSLSRSPPYSTESALEARIAGEPGQEYTQRAREAKSPAKESALAQIKAARQKSKGLRPPSRVLDVYPSGGKQNSAPERRYGSVVLPQGLVKGALEAGAGSKAWEEIQRKHQEERLYQERECERLDSPPGVGSRYRNETLTNSGDHCLHHQGQVRNAAFSRRDHSPSTNRRDISLSREPPSPSPMTDRTRDSILALAPAIGDLGSSSIPSIPEPRRGEWSAKMRPLSASACFRPTTVERQNDKSMEHKSVERTSRSRSTGRVSYRNQSSVADSGFGISHSQHTESHPAEQRRGSSTSRRGSSTSRSRSKSDRSRVTHAHTEHPRGLQDKDGSEFWATIKNRSEPRSHMESGGGGVSAQSQSSGRSSSRSRSASGSYRMKLKLKQERPEARIKLNSQERGEGRGVVEEGKRRVIKETPAERRQRLLGGGSLTVVKAPAPLPETPAPMNSHASLPLSLSPSVGTVVASPATMRSTSPPPLCHVWPEKRARFRAAVGISNLLDEGSLLPRLMRAVGRLSNLLQCRCVSKAWRRSVGLSQSQVCDKVTTVDMLPAAETLEKCPNVERIELDGAQLSLSEVQDLLEAIAGTPGLVSLNLSGLDLSGPCTSSLLSNALGSLPRLQALYLVGSQLASCTHATISVFEALRERVKHSGSMPLHVLDLSKNNLTASANSFVATDALGELIAESHELRTLRLDECQLTAAGARPILDSLSMHRVVRELHIGGNTTGSVAASGSSLLLSVNGGCLERLNLEGNGLRLGDVEQLGATLHEDSCLVWLRLGYPRKGIHMQDLTRMGKQKALQLFRDPLDQAFIDKYLDHNC